MAELFQVIVWTVTITSWTFAAGLVMILIIFLCWYMYGKGFEDGMAEERLEHAVNSGSEVTYCEHDIPHRYACSQCTHKYLDELGAQQTF